MDVSTVMRFVDGCTNSQVDFQVAVTILGDVLDILRSLLRVGRADRTQHSQVSSPSRGDLKACVLISLDKGLIVARSVLDRSEFVVLPRVLVPLPIRIPEHVVQLSEDVLPVAWLRFTGSRINEHTH